ncbi:MAG: hypothetical protein WBR13_08920 [Allosphingosinicella sp.]
MRDPARKALYCFLLVAASAGLIWFGAVRQETVASHWTGVVPVLLGLALLPFPLYILVEALFAVRGRAKLLAGIGVIARWRVSPVEWEVFRGLDGRRIAKDISLANDFWIRKAALEAPVEVIVGEKSALVDGSYHSLKPGGLPDLRGVRWIEGPPACLEFATRYPRSRHSPPVDTTVRIPVAAGARAEAVRVLDHFERLLRPPARRKPAGASRVWTILAAGTVAAVAAYAVLRDFPESAARFVLPGLAIAGSVLAIFAAVIALAMFLSNPKR